MPLYAVDRYRDAIKVKQKKEYDQLLKQDCYYYSDDENLAKMYIIRRALMEVEKAKTALDKANSRHAKCIKKFGIKTL